MAFARWLGFSCLLGIRPFGEAVFFGVGGGGESDRCGERGWEFLNGKGGGGGGMEYITLTNVFDIDLK